MIILKSLIKFSVCENLFTPMQFLF